jgi:hypothetical protein
MKKGSVNTRNKKDFMGDRNLYFSYFCLMSIKIRGICIIH